MLGTSRGPAVGRRRGWCRWTGFSRRRCAWRLTPGSADTLTVREREVLQLMAEGLPNKLIAARLSISQHTVKFHVASILAKLGAASRTEAVALGARLGYLVL
jgi:DNA-binding CsgD family transcriptional regulator